MAMAAMGNPQNGGPDGGKVIGHVYTMLPEWNMVPIAILQFFNSMFKKGLHPFVEFADFFLQDFAESQIESARSVWTKTGYAIVLERTWKYLKDEMATIEY